MKRIKYLRYFASNSLLLTGESGRAKSPVRFCRFIYITEWISDTLLPLLWAMGGKIPLCFRPSCDTYSAMGQLFLCDAIVEKTLNADRAVERLQRIADNATDLLWGGLGPGFRRQEFYRSLQCGQE